MHGENPWTQDDLHRDLVPSLDSLDDALQSTQVRCASKLLRVPALLAQRRSQLPKLAWLLGVQSKHPSPFQEMAGPMVGTYGYTRP